MSYVLALRKGSQTLFEKLDKLKIGKAGLFQFYFPFWQLAIYFGITAYFILTLIFQENPYIYATGLKAPIVLIYEILHQNGTHMNPILNRGLDNGGHVLAYLSLITCALWVRVKLPKTSEGFYYSILIPAFALSVSEGSFNIFYWALNYHLWPHPSWFVFLLTNPLAALYIFTVLIGTIITPVTKFIPKQYLYIAVVWIETYFVIWAAFGFPVTLSSIEYLQNGNLETVWFSNIPTNLTEIGQWCLASLAFGLITRIHPQLLPPKI